MSADKPSSYGPLALLGGEGLRHDSRGLWQRLASSHGQPARAVIVPAALGGQAVGAAERHTGLAQETLAGWDIAAEVVAGPERLDALHDAGLIALPGGDARTLIESLAGSDEWNAILEAHAHGAALAAAGSSAMGLGAVAFAPPKPGPETLDDLSYEAVDGLGLLPGLAILPYFNWLQETLVRRITALCPPGTWLVGIDDQAALIATGRGWHADGLGQVTIWQPGGRAQVVDAGQSLPADLLPPYPPR